MNIRRKDLLRVWTALAAFWSGCTLEPDQNAGTIQLHPDVRYQTISGWEATAEIGQSECDSFLLYKDEVLDLAADSLGINRLRVEVRSSVEHPEDRFQALMDGQTEHSEWRKVRYETLNDNADPDSIDWEGFHFTELDRVIGHVVLPLRERLQGRGERLAISVNYVAFTGQSPTQYVHQDPQEYAEFVLATYIYLDKTYDLIPDAWEVILEPDNRTPWDGRAVGDAIVAAGKKLEAHGYRPAFIAPSTMNTRAASTFIDEMMQVEGAPPYVREFSYHRYGDATPENVRRIVEQGERHRVPVAMLEYMDADYETLHEDLTVGQNVAWQQLALAFCNASSGRDYINIDLSEPQQPEVRLSPSGRYYRQYFQHVRAGAVRIGASSVDGFDPVAFVNTDGGYVVIVKAEREGEVAIAGLPPAKYGVSSTTETGTRGQPLQSIGRGDTLRVFIPGKGVLTAFALHDAVPRAAD